MILKPISRIVANIKIKRSKSTAEGLSAFSGKGFEDIKTVLLISPNQSSDISEAEDSIQVVEDQFTKVKIIFFNSADIPEKSKNLYGYPKKDYLKSFQENEYDLIIDLSMKYSLLNTFIITHMNPAIRVKVYNDHRNDIYYNFIFSSQKKTYVNLTRHCLTMLHHVLSKKIIS